MRLLILPLMVAALAAGSCSNPSASGDYQLVWEDEFTGAAGTLPNASNWGYDIGTDWGNAQLEYDTNRPENVSLDGNGNLVITARRETYLSREYTSARITTAGKREFTYGRYEARIKAPIGQGIWPAFWLLGADIATVGWPQTGEIDIFEYRGQEPAINHGTLHGPGYSGGGGITRKYTLPSGSFNEDFHTFAIEWEPNRIPRWHHGLSAGVRDRLGARVAEAGRRYRHPVRRHGPRESIREWILRVQRWGWRQHQREHGPASGGWLRCVASSRHTRQPSATAWA